MCWCHLQLTRCSLENFPHPPPVWFESSIGTGTVFIYTYGKSCSFSVLKSKMKKNVPTGCEMYSGISISQFLITLQNLRKIWPQNLIVFILCLKLHFSLLKVAFSFPKESLHYADLWVNSVGATHFTHLSTLTGVASQLIAPPLSQVVPRYAKNWQKSLSTNFGQMCEDRSFEIPYLQRGRRCGGSRIWTSAESFSVWLLHRQCR